MPGSRPTGFLFGASAERLAEFIVGSFAFTTPVPYPVDVGHDFHCVLHRPATNRRTLRAGPAFSVRVKSRPGPVAYEAGPAAVWLSDQESPLFLCIVDRPTLTCELYSTWNIHNAHLRTVHCGQSSSRARPSTSSSYRCASTTRCTFRSAHSCSG
jgi:hypothetical protein